MAKKDRLVERMASLMAMETGCHMRRDDALRLVVSFVRDQGFAAATETSNFSVDVPVDELTRRGWAAPIRKRIFTAGCDPKGFGPADCERARKVGDIVEALFKELK